MLEYKPTRKTNRHAKKKAKTSSAGWCDCCDAELVSNGEKCFNRGVLNGTKRFKPQDEPIYDVN